MTEGDALTASRSSRPEADSAFNKVAAAPAWEGRDGAAAGPARLYEVANFRSLMASKSCTPPPTRLVV